MFCTPVTIVLTHCNQLDSKRFGLFFLDALYLELRFGQVKLDIGLAIFFTFKQRQPGGMSQEAKSPLKMSFRLSEVRRSPYPASAVACIANAHLRRSPPGNVYRSSPNSCRQFDASRNRNVPVQMFTGRLLRRVSNRVLRYLSVRKMTAALLVLNVGSNLNCLHLLKPLRTV